MTVGIGWWSSRDHICCEPQRWASGPEEPISAATATKERFSVQRCRNSSVRGSHNPGRHRPGHLVTKVGGCSPLKQRTSLFLETVWPEVLRWVSSEKNMGAYNEVPAFQTGFVSPSQSLHQNSAGKRSSLVVTLVWLLKLSVLSAGKALKLDRVLPGHQGSCWTEDASTGHPTTFRTS